MSSPLRIGVLLVGTVQLLDLSAVDLLYMTTPEYLQECSLPQPLVDLGRPCEIHYIAHNANDTAKTTAQMSLQLTDSLTDSAVSPGKLDIVLIPGPPPKAMPPPEEYLDFVRAHFAAGAPILSVCTGAYVIGHAGITKGREVTAPRLLIPEMRRKFPEAKLWDDSVRVARDGNLWTSGGITNGHDLVAGYLREYYPAALVNTILVAADIPSRPAAYATPAVSDTLYILWQIIRAVPNAVVGWFRGR